MQRVAIVVALDDEPLSVVVLDCDQRTGSHWSVLPDDFVFIDHLGNFEMIGPQIILPLSIVTFFDFLCSEVATILTIDLIRHLFTEIVEGGVLRGGPVSGVL